MDLFQIIDLFFFSFCWNRIFNYTIFFLKKIPKILLSLSLSRSNVTLLL